MKKRLTFLALIIFSGIILNGCATMMGAKAAPEMRTYEEILEISGKTKDQIYIKANGWFVETFNSAESVIEFQDKEAGKIMGKYVFNYSEGVYGYSIKQTVDLEMKEEKIRVKINNPLYKTISGMGEVYNNTVFRPLETQKGIERARAEWSSLVKSLEDYLKQNDEW